MKRAVVCGVTMADCLCRVTAIEFLPKSEPKMRTLQR